MEPFAFAITLTVALVSVLGAVSMGLSGLYLNFRYPKSKIERAELEIQRLTRELAEWRARAERCEQLVVRSMSDAPSRSGGVNITDSHVQVGRDLFGGDEAKRDDENTETT